jgi:hypothetical protein
MMYNVWKNATQAKVAMLEQTDYYLKKNKL